MRICLGALTFIDSVMSFPFTPIYPTISTLRSSYSSHIFILITSSERSICDGQVLVDDFRNKNKARAPTVWMDKRVIQFGI
jgi:hypothetical protein